MRRAVVLVSGGLDSMLEAVCTDPGALNDIPEWCRISGYRVIDARPGADEQVIIVEVSR